jgi:putative DNA-invertase from lambdoid prophage Rac
MKAALYARVSTAESKDLQDPESQLIKLRQYAEFRDLGIHKEYIEYASGCDDDRPVLKEMLNDAKKGGFKTILVFRIDRLSRSTYKLFSVMQDLKDWHVNVISVTEGLDTESRLSEGIFLMLGIVAGWEREGIVERINAGVQRARKNGTKSGRPIGRPRKPFPETKANQLLEGNPGISNSELARLLGVSRSRVIRYKEEIQK